MGRLGASALLGHFICRGGSFARHLGTARFLFQALVRLTLGDRQFFTVGSLARFLGSPVGFRTLVSR
ncbi:MAG: hypothetical protein R3D67_12255 [Hyphomicrobiaceae bacterium]